MLCSGLRQRACLGARLRAAGRVPGALRAAAPSRGVALRAGRAARHNAAPVDPDAALVSVVFVEPGGERVEVTAHEGQNLLDVAHLNDVELEGACEGSLACSTCHVILPEAEYDLLEEPTDEENDMLDMAFGLTETSRLGCQVKLSPQLEGMEIVLPSATRNMQVDAQK